MTLAELTDRLTNVNFLEFKGGSLTEKRNKSKNSATPLFTMTLEELRQVDARLPTAIDGQLEVTKELLNGDAQPTMSGVRLKRTLQIWQNIQILSTKDAGEVAYDSLYEFDDVRLDEQNPIVRLALRGSLVREYTGSDGVTIRMAGPTKNEAFAVCPAWLDVTFPGWQNRYLVASALGYREDHLVEYTLSKSITSLNNTKDIDGVAFY